MNATLISSVTEIYAINKQKFSPHRKDILRWRAFFYFSCNILDFFTNICYNLINNYELLEGGEYQVLVPRFDEGQYEQEELITIVRDSWYKLLS